ncbi:cleavage and polyadenylation specificity factor subunit 1-like isoform X2 [Xenia sp. Carnegie-2017]|uniref:cleavage and polyadenylation specificity factor subunit 1-like isoform X2 n=1 Tax=Xenia sp. Carnegie-2017 TaxID=2897299 RepID=UPI001F039A69|nr:cleavage and polyadenylation specificity factor subunit 1-like isoform X2 [Xenia sp. Carnegie-2017]
MYDLYAIFKQAHPPSVIEHCLVCNFYSFNERNLVVAGTSLLRIYRLAVDEDEVHQKSEDTEGDTSTTKKLEMVGQFSLFGAVKSIKSVKLSRNDRDSLLLSFDDAKLAIIEYDPCMHDLKTTSLHYFEEDELKGGMKFHFNDPTVRVDPANRCAAMWIYSHWLVVLPFKQDGIYDEHEPNQSVGNKGQVLPSYTINMREINMRLNNVIDIQFLHGYFEPTLLILYEPLKTWPGRLAVRQDTCAMLAISLNLSEKVNPIIWSVEHLPFDCCQVLPIPKPIGGILLFATNSLLYLNQSVPAYGVSLNSIAKKSSSFPLREQENITITLDDSCGSFIANDRVVISLKGGEIYVLTLITDGIKSVRGFNFDKAASSVQTSCLCYCEEGYLFLGSRLGNSLLLRYTQKVDKRFPNGVNPTKPNEGFPPHMKRRKLDSECMHGLTDEVDDLEVYGADTKSAEVTTYTFEVCDSLINIGPCSCVDMGEPAFLSEEFAETSFPDMEIVTCSGYGKNGALSLLQKSIRPQVVTTFELPGCVDMWTVTSHEPKENENESDEDESVNDDGFANHSFLILSRKDSSMVLRTEQEIMELDHSGFSTQHPTVCAANLGEGRYILQVTPMGVRLLDGINQIQHIPMDADFSSIIWCSVADPYTVMMTADGTLMLLTFTCENSSPNLIVARVKIDQWSKVCACCVYKDTSGMFTTEKIVEPVHHVQQQPIVTPKDPILPSTNIMTTDDEEEMLYGESDISNVFTDTSSFQAETSFSVPSTRTDIKPSFWCVVCRQNGALEIYSVPEFKLVFCVRNFAFAPKVLVDSGSIGSTGSSQSQEENLLVKEILLTGLPDKNPKPLLAALVDHDLMLYEAFSYNDSSTEGHLNIRFKKMQHNVLVREKKSKTKTKETTSEDDVKEMAEPMVGRLRPFHDISTYSGIFVCGANPFWLFKSSRNALRSHPMTIDGAVSSFVPFRNVNCPKGFLYFNKEGELRVSVLPTHLSYDAPWPVRKVPLRCTPHFIAYNRESKFPI